MTIREALQIAYSLALDNMVDEAEMPDVYRDQAEALAMFHDLIVNDYGDD